MTSLDTFNNYAHFDVFTRFSPIITNGLTLLILVESSNYIGDLFPSSVIKTFEHNNFMKHLIALISCIYYCVVHDGEIINVSEQILTGILIYILFILFTKVEMTLFFIIMGITFILFLIHVYKQYNLYNVHMYYINKFYGEELDTEIDTDIEIESEVDIDELKLYDLLSYIQTGSFIMVIILCMIGFISKLLTKWHKYKSCYNISYGYLKFLSDFIFLNLKN